MVDLETRGLPVFAVVTPTGVARAIIQGRDAAFRLQDYFQRADCFPHTVRPARDDDHGPGVLSNL